MEKRDKLVGALIRKTEYEAFETYCRELGVTKSNLIRELILNEMGVYLE